MLQRHAAVLTTIKSMHYSWGRKVVDASIKRTLHNLHGDQQGVLMVPRRR